MLLGNFFNINETTTSGNTISVNIEINALHHIFDGHFPGQPVVPGVCMLQMVKELLETQVKRKLQLKKADQLKFLAVINPVINPVITAEFSYENKDGVEIAASGRLYKDEVTFLKFKASFVEQLTIDN